MATANEPNFYVYAIFRPDGRPCYIGKGCGPRWTRHEWRSTNPHLANIVRLAGGTLPKIKLCEGLIEQEAFDIEIMIIRLIGREIHGGPLVNMTDGGEGVSGYKRTPEDNEKSRISHLGMIPWNIGKRTPDETRKKQSIAKLGKKQNPEHVEKRSASNRGRIRDPSVGLKISATKIGKKWSEERRAILRAANRSGDPEVRAKISIATRLGMAAAKERRQLSMMGSNL